MQQLSVACWGCALCRSYLLIKNVGSCILLCFKQISTLNFPANPQIWSLWEKFGVLLVFIKNKREKSFAPGIIAFVSSLFRLLSSAELMSAKWANLKDPFSLTSFKNTVSLGLLKNHR